MELYSETDSYKLYHGNMLDMLSVIDPNSIDSVVCDPPYELGFMNKAWDSSGVAFHVDTWKKCLQVLKPGGYLLAFGAPRLYHRLACAIEDAGFEIRDTIFWVFGSGFPKSMNIGLAIDKANGVESEVIGYTDAPDLRDVGEQSKANTGINKLSFGQTENAKRTQAPIYKCQNEWDGWGTSLKPAYESIIVARKPLDGTVVENVLKYGVGGINIDECRVPISQSDIYIINAKSSKNPTDNYNRNNAKKYGDYALNIATEANDKGRFPSNVILTYDETDEEEVCGGFPYTTSSGGSGEKSIGGGLNGNVYNGGWTHDVIAQHLGGLGDSERASRYYYTAKASKKDRNEGLDNLPDEVIATSNQAQAELKRGNEEFEGNQDSAFKNFNKVRKVKNTHNR